VWTEVVSHAPQRKQHTGGSLQASNNVKLDSVGGRAMVGAFDSKAPRAAGP
jgi:hypothetical protein